MPVKLTIEFIQEVAKSYGGKCLSKKYFGVQVPLKWMCKNGHTFDRRFDVIQYNGIWCPQCSKNDKWYEKFQELAEERGGTLMTENYVSIETKYKWKCKEGHVFILRAVSIKNGAWCPVCQEKKRRQQELEKLKKIAIKKGILFVSGNYKTKYSRLKWKCSKGHLWEATGNTIRKGRICPTCKRDKACEKRLIEFRKIAEKNGGKCLSKTFINVGERLRWQCSKGHVWSAPAKDIMKGQWCRECNRDQTLKLFQQKQRKYTYADFQKYAKKRGGKLLTKKISSTSDVVEWQCKMGHKWSVKARSVLYHKTWCRQCHYDEKRLKLEDFQVLARSRGGKLLSKVYRNLHVNLKWQCEKGHVWEAVAGNVKRGSWCPQCNLENRNKKS